MAHVPTTITMYAARQLGITFSFTGHANDLFPERTLLTEKLKRARFTVCISHWHRGFYQAIYPLPDERLPVVRCGVDCPSVNRLDTPEHAVPVLLSVGRLVPKKGFDILIHAISKLNGQGRQVHAVVIGDGPQCADLEALAAQLGVAASVRFLGARSHEEVIQTLAGADLFVLPSRVTQQGDRDGIPVALMEAMAAGVCVIGGDLPAIRELVRHEETGLLVPPDDPESLATAIHRLLEAPALRRDLAHRGHEWVRQEFSREQNVQRLVELFQGCNG
jgi:glycosyltransferase involved in cell wall biosynthesis